MKRARAYQFWFQIWTPRPQKPINWYTTCIYSKVLFCATSRARTHKTSARIPILTPNLDSSTPKTYKLIYNMYLKCYFVRLCARAHETSARIPILTPNSDSSTPKTHSLTPRTSKSDEIWRLFNFGRFFTFLRHCAPVDIANEYRFIKSIGNGGTNNSAH